jgi:hypothetical protein
MARKNIEDYFGEKNRDKSKCKNILDYDFVEETASKISPEKQSDDENYDIKKTPNSRSNKKSPAIRKYETSYIKYGFNN